MDRRKIGIAGPFSGPRREYGDLLATAAREALAEDRLGAARKNPGIVFGDDGANPVMACKAAKNLISEGCRVVVGHFNSDAARAAGALYREAGIALVLPAATRDGLAEEIGAFRLCAPDRAQVAALAGACAGPRVALLHDGTAYADRLVQAFVAHGMTRAYVTDIFALERCRAAPETDDAVLLGTHVAIRAALRRWTADAIDAAIGMPRFFACDDCSIATFMDGVPESVSVSIASPAPDFRTATRRGLHLAIEAVLAAPGDEIAFLRLSGLFDKAGESRDAKFTLHARCGAGTDTQNPERAEAPE